MSKQLITVSSAAPTGAPSAKGLIWIDDTNSKVYISVDTASVGDWIDVSNNSTQWGTITGDVADQADLIAEIFGGGTYLGNLDINENELQNAYLYKYTEKAVVNATVTGTYDVDWSLGNVQVLTLTGNTTLTFSNVPASPKISSMTLFLIQDATGGRTLTLPAAVSFGDSGTPTYNTGASKVNVLAMTSYNGGTKVVAIAPVTGA